MVEKWFFEENEKIAFEIDASDERRLAQTIVSFSNFDGGSIFFGVTAKAKIVGCFPKEIIEAINQIVLKYIINLEASELKTHEFNNKLVVEYGIHKSKIPLRIIQMDSDSGYYLRCNSRNEKAGKIISAYFHLLSKSDPNLNVDSFLADSIISLISNEGPLTLAQLYKLSDLKKSEIDEVLPILLFNEQMSYSFTDYMVRFY